jgi:hypothetical protein
MGDEETADRATGQVINEQTNQGVPGLLVELYFLAAPKSRWRGESRDGAVNIRLGSAATDGQGCFELVYNDSDFKACLGRDSCGRPDLTLVVLSPEAPGADPGMFNDENAQALISYLSPSTRRA